MRLDVDTGIWLQVESMVTARCTHSAAVEKDSNSILVCGGFNGEVHSSSERYMIDKDIWVRSTHMIHERFMHCLIDDHSSISIL